MIYLSLLKTSLQSLKANKIRTFLTVLGVMIGIMSVIVVYSASSGLNNLILGEFEAFGTNIIETEIKIPTSKKGVAAEQQNASAMVMGVQITTLTLKDLKEISDLPNVTFGYPMLMGQEQVNYKGEVKNGKLMGTNQHFIDIDQSEVAEGRFFTEAENNSLAKVVVLGANIKDDLFGDNQAIGKLIKIKHSKYRVIGVMKERGAMLSFNWDDMIYLPIKTLQKRLMGVSYISAMIHQLKDPDLADATAVEMREVLRRSHNISDSGLSQDGAVDTGHDDFRVTTMGEMMKTLNIITNALTWLLLAIVAISLLVGGIGIMNVMYVIVGERSSEIGLRKAVGATYNKIMWQFLLEAIVVTLLGGLMGIISGVIISFLISLGANYAGLDWRFSVPLEAYVVALSFSTFFGLLFGIYPARKAALMDPIVAMRQE